MIRAEPSAQRKSLPRVTVCVATKNRTDMLHQFLWSLIRQEFREWDLLIVDDSDEPVRWDRFGVYPRLFAEMKRTRHEVTIVAGPRVNRIGAAYQAGLIASPREVPLFFRADDDSWMEPDCLAKLVAVMDDEDVGACGGLFLHPGGAEIDTLMPDDPRYRHATIEGLSDHFNIQWHRHSSDNLVPVEHLTANILFRRKWLETIGGFETMLYQQHRDETQATWRLHVAGAKLFVRPDAVAWHLKASTGGARGHHPDVYVEDHRKFMAQRKTMQPGIHISLGHAIGDGFMATPMLNIMRKMNPDRNIAVFAPWAKDVLCGNPDVDAIAEHPLDHQRTVRLEQSVYNWASAKRWKGHLAEAYCRMFNLPLPEDVNPHFHFLGDEFSDELPRSDFIVIAPWSSAKTFDFYQASGNKNWLMDRWKSVVKWAHQNDFIVVQLRGSQDEPLVEDVDLDFACRPLRAAFGCIGKARLLVSVDTMAHHAAAALGVPTVVLWGRSKPEHFGYRRDNIVNIQGACPGVPVPARL
ncbi:MAG: glycosyltransferase, partial [Deltaproteobacteria bacterium]